jgi:hypothetical protein
MAPRQAKQAPTNVENSRIKSIKTNEETTSKAKIQRKEDSVKALRVAKAQLTSSKGNAKSKARRARKKDKIKNRTAEESDAEATATEGPQAEKQKIGKSRAATVQDVMEVFHELHDNIINAIRQNRNDAEAFQTEIHQANAAQKFILQPGEFTTSENRAMLVITTGKPPLDEGSYNIGYNKEITLKGLKGEWKFVSHGCPNSEEWTARVRLMSKGYNELQVMTATGQDFYNLRQDGIGDLGNDGVTTGIIIVWIPDVPYSEKKAQKSKKLEQVKESKEAGKARTLDNGDDASKEEEGQEGKEVQEVQMNEEGEEGEEAGGLDESRDIKKSVGNLDVNPLKNRGAIIPGTGKGIATRQRVRQASTGTINLQNTSNTASKKGRGRKPAVPPVEEDTEAEEAQDIPEDDRDGGKST